ncbi:MAG: hypothetical protein JWP81_1557 [Ferruginibacter sp.]|nr:hypothetical protein [Ferruginibacter sp.]
MAIKNNPTGDISPHIIRFQDNNYQLTREWLDKEVDAKVRNNDDWRWPTLKFISYQEGHVTLLNTCGNRSHTLMLQVKDGHLLVNCSCSNTGITICEHAYAGLYTIIWHLGERYFEKLQPNGTIALAFAYKNYFDKEETTAGLNVSVRPELKSVFRLAQKLETIDLPAILKLPALPAQEEVSHPAEALGYLVIISYRSKLLPALLPCVGKLNKIGTDIKIFNQFLSGVQKQYSNLVTDSQQELNTACYHLWKMVEKIPGHIIQKEPIQKMEDKLSAIFGAWKKILPLLQKQQFIYSYYLYGLRELKDRPAKKRIQKITLSELLPALRFMLADKGAFYQLQLQVWLNGKLLTGYDAGIAFFIRHQETFYMLSSLRDAAIAEWIHRSGGWITIFKEHFSQFEQEVLMPLRESYTIETSLSKTMRKR